MSEKKDEVRGYGFSNEVSMKQVAGGGFVSNRSWPTRVSRKKRSPSMMFWCIGFEASRLAAMVIRRRQSFEVVLSSLADANAVFAGILCDMRGGKITYPV